MTNLAWAHIKRICQLNNSGSKDELVAYLDANINDIKGHALSAAITSIELTPNFVQRHYATLKKITQRRELFDDKELDFRDHVRLRTLDNMISHIQTNH